MNQSGGLPVYAKYLIAVLILIMAGVLEMFLITLYGAFFVNEPRNASLTLALAAGNGERIPIWASSTMERFRYAERPNQSAPNSVGTGSSTARRT
jgi:hypothetical protein